MYMSEDILQKGSCYVEKKMKKNAVFTLYFGVEWFETVTCVYSGEPRRCVCKTLRKQVSGHSAKTKLAQLTVTKAWN